MLMSGGPLVHQTHLLNSKRCSQSFGLTYVNGRWCSMRERPAGAVLSLTYVNLMSKTQLNLLSTDDKCPSRRAGALFFCLPLEQTVNEGNTEANVGVNIRGQYSRPTY